MIDSQAAIKSLENINTTSNLVVRTKQALNELGRNYSVELHWVKAHVNNKGNEIADRAAKTGCCITDREPTSQSNAFV